MNHDPGFSFETHGFEQGGIQVMGPGRSFSLVFTIKAPRPEILSGALYLPAAGIKKK